LAIKVGSIFLTCPGGTTGLDVVVALGGMGFKFCGLGALQPIKNDVNNATVNAIVYFFIFINIIPHIVQTVKYKKPSEKFGGFDIITN